MHFYRKDPKTGLVEKADAGYGEESGYINTGWVPSVTTIFMVIRRKRAIELWEIKNCIKFFIEQKLKPTKKDLNVAATYEDRNSSDFGTICHAIVANSCQGLPIPPEIEKQITDQHRECCAPVIDWWKENVAHGILAEHSFVNHELGYAGTLDFFCVLHSGEYMLGDFKFKKDSKMYPMKPDWQYEMQLCAYAKQVSVEYGIPYDKILRGNVLGAAPNPPHWTGPRVSVHMYKEDVFDLFNMTRVLWMNSINSD